jgi:hypothetical protein
MKALIVIALIGVVAALASAGAFMLRERRDPGAGAAADPRMARALAVRIGLSVALFLFVLLSWLMGWVRPGGLPVGG